MSDPSQPRTPEERQILSMVRWLLYLAFVVVGFLVVRKLGPILTPVLAAGAVAYLLDGLVDRMSRRGLNRTLTVGILLVSFIGLVVGVLFLVIPLVTEEVASFIVALPILVDRAAGFLGDNFGLALPRDWKAFLQGAEFRSFLESAVGPASDVAQAALGGVFSFLGWLAELLLVPVFAFYFLVDWDHLVHRVHAFVPPRHRDVVAEVAAEIDVAVSIWVRGQLTVMAVLAALYAVSFKAAGLHLGVTVGILVGLLTVIPFLGTLVGAALALAVVVLDWQGPGQLVAVSVTFVVLHLIEAAVLTPRLVGKRVGLGEVGALFAVLAGGQLLGFAGVLLAVPIAASIAVLVRRAVRFYQASDFYTQGSELVTGLAPEVTARAVLSARRTRPTARTLSLRPTIDPLEQRAAAEADASASDAHFPVVRTSILEPDPAPGAGPPADPPPDAAPEGRPGQANEDPT